MIVVADTGPLVAAANRRDEAHQFAASLVNGLGRDLVIPVTVIAEVDYLIRARISSYVARSFLKTLARGGHRVAYLSQRVLESATRIDEQYADLELGFTDATVMAYAEQQDLPILTFDFVHFRATGPTKRGYWRLVVDEERYRAATGA